MAKPLPDEPALPWLVRAAWVIWTWVTWPAQVRQMKAAGFRHTGFMTWETGPADEVCLKCGTRSCLDDARLGGGFG